MIAIYPIAGIAPPFSPPLVSPAASGRTGASISGLTPNPIRAGVNIAFASSPSSEAPLWQLLNELGPT